MKSFLIAALSGLLLASPAGAQETQVPVSIIQLIATPERFDGKLVRVTGFLVLTEQASLFLHREDAEHGIASNSLSVVPSSDMRRDQQKLHGMYVRIVGVFHKTPTEGGWVLLQLREIKECLFVSDPDKPQKLDGKRPPGTREK